MKVENFRIPNDEERRVLFAWLKRASSWTGWNLFLQRHRVFSGAVDKAFQDDQKRPHPADKDYLYVPDDWLRDIYVSEAATEQALDRLRKGDRRCFLFLGAPGHFSQGLVQVTAWRDLYYYRFLHLGEGDFPPSESPYWPEMNQALLDTLDVSYDLRRVLQTRLIDEPAPIGNLDDFDPVVWANMVRRVPTDLALARVPEPLTNVLVKTGRTVPEYGIWEPVVEVSKGVLQIDGAMNYLHGGTDAPTIAFANDTQRHEGRKTLWRLLWADHRYGADPIPEEEKTYEFGGYPRQ